MTRTTTPRPMMDNPFVARGCIWPDCASRFALGTGPLTPGWTRVPKVGRTAALCPFHVDMGHRPDWTLRSPVMVPTCECGDTGPPVFTLRGVRESWTRHIYDKQEGRIR